MFSSLSLFFYWPVCPADGGGDWGIGMCWEWVPNCFLLIQIAHHRQQHFSGLQKRSAELSLFITLLTPQLDPLYARILRTHLHPFTYPGSLSLGFNWSDVPHCGTAQWQWRAPLSGWMRAGVFIRWAWMSSGGAVLRAGGYPRPSGWVKLYVSPASLSSQLPCSSSVVSSSQHSDAWPWKAADAFVGKVGFVCAWRMNPSGAKERPGSKMDHRKAKTTSSDGKRGNRWALAREKFHHSTVCISDTNPSWWSQPKYRLQHCRKKWYFIDPCWEYSLHFL